MSRSPSDRPRPLLAYDELTLLAFISGGVLLVLALSRHFRDRDFDIFYASVVNLAQHADPYGGRLGAFNTNPPHLAGLMLPLSAFTLTAAYWIWTAISLAAILAAAFIARRARTLALTRGIGAVFLAYSGTFYQLAGGQVAWLLALPMTLAWAGGPTLASGFLVGCCATVKPFLFLFGLYFLWRRQWRSVAGFAAGSLLTLGIGIAALGWPVYRSWAGALGRLNTAFLYSNGSIYGIVAKVSQPEGLNLLGAVTARGIWFLASAVVGAMALWALRGREHHDLEWAIVVLTALLISPLGQPYYLALALGPLWTVLPRMAWPRWGLGVLALFWWPNLLTSPDVPTKLWQLIPYNLMALGLISLWAILLFAGIPPARDDGEATSTASSLPPPLRRSW